jgi:uncharacterized protein
VQSITLLIKPTSYHCNLACDYCFYRRVKEVYPGRQSFMDLATAEALVRKTLQLGCPQNLFCWQGGEPTLMGLDFFREVMRFQRQWATPGQIVENTLQTNGTLLDEAWADFLAEHRFLVGLSLDGPRTVHDRYRKHASGKGTHAQVMHAASLLSNRGVPFNILTLLTTANVSQAGTLYAFFRHQGWTHLQFIPCWERDPVTSERLDFSIDSRDLGKFYCELFDLWMKDGYSKVSIRTFEDILIYHIDGVHVSCSWFERCSAYLVVEHNGDVYPCDFFVYPDWKLGNIVQQSYGEILDNPRWSQFVHQKAELPPTCTVCRWLSFCHGDCTRFRTDSEGGFTLVSTYCGARKMLLEHMEPHLEGIRREALRIRRERQRESSSRLGRNEPCGCGSGRKFKRCCGR